VAIDPANTATADCATGFDYTEANCNSECIYTINQYVLQSDRAKPALTVVGIETNLEYTRGDDTIVEPRWAAVGTDIDLEITFSKDVRMPVLKLATTLCVPSDAGAGECPAEVAAGDCCIQHDMTECSAPKGANECGRFHITYKVPDDAVEEANGVSLGALFEATASGTQSAYYVPSEHFPVPEDPWTDLDPGTDYAWTDTATDGTVWSAWAAEQGGTAI
jgi:hypothetical protein